MADIKAWYEKTALNIATAALNTEVEINGETTTIESALKKIEEMIPHWIPCNEKLPENLQTVLVVWMNHEPETYYSEIKDKTFTAPFIYCNGEWYWWSSTCDDYLAETGQDDWDKIDPAIEITHWMPLPEPPEKE